MNSSIFKLYILFLFFSKSLFSQIYHGYGGSIPNDSLEKIFTIHIQHPLPQIINTSTWGLESVCIEITHTNLSDLSIILEAPDGTQVLLISAIGNGENTSYTCFSSNAQHSVLAGNIPFNGTYRPLIPLGLINNGQDANGKWNLIIKDISAASNVGFLSKWQLTFSNQPSKVYYIDSTNVPLIIINTDYTPIPNEPKLTAHMGIIDNGYREMNHSTDPLNQYNGLIGIEVRGTSSQAFPKKSYAIETRNNQGENINVSLLGMPADNDWILLANYNDLTLLRNSITFELSQKLGRWAPRSRFCELIVNNENKGLYLMVEKIKRSINRVNISAIYPNSNTGDAITGGYIIKIDRLSGSGNRGWYSNYFPTVNLYNQYIYFLYHYPKPDIISFEQEIYIKSCVDSFETALFENNFSQINGYYNYVDLNSFIDYFIINEVAKNVDAYRTSTFFYKDKYSKNGKLVMGPPWDFDLAYGNADYCGADDYTGWAYDIGSICPTQMPQPPFWWNKLLTDTLFANKLNCRWYNLRASILDTTFIFNYIDSIQNYIALAQLRNENQWPFYMPTTYSGEVSNLKKWFRNRLTWLDANMPGNCNISSSNTILTSSVVKTYPNPANDIVYVQSDFINQKAHYEMYDLANRLIQKGDLIYDGDEKYFRLNQTIQNGYYFLTIVSEGETFLQKVLVIKP